MPQPWIQVIYKWQLCHKFQVLFGHRGADSVLGSFLRLYFCVSLSLWPLFLLANTVCLCLACAIIFSWHIKWYWNFCSRRVSISDADPFAPSGAQVLELFVVLNSHILNCWLPDFLYHWHKLLINIQPNSTYLCSFVIVICFKFKLIFYVVFPLFCPPCFAFVCTVFTMDTVLFCFALNVCLYCANLACWCIHKNFPFGG